MSDKAENAGKSDNAKQSNENIESGIKASAVPETGESSQLYRTLLYTLDEGFAVVEMIFDAAGKPVDYRFIEINPEFEKLTGLENPLVGSIRHQGGSAYRQIR